MITLSQSTKILIRTLFHADIYSTEQSPSREAKWFSASQEIPPILWDPEGSLPHLQEPATCPYSEPNQSCPCPTIPIRIHFTIFLPYTPGSSKWSLSFRLPHQNPVQASPLLPLCYMPCPTHYSRYDHANNVWWGVQIINLLKPELNPICYLLALLRAHHFLHVSRIRVKLLTFRLLMPYTYGAPILDVSRSHTTTQHSR